MPDISVLTPSYGYGQYLADCVDSVLRQPGPTLELVVQDAGSTDATTQVLEGYDDPRVHWTTEPDEGQSDALNRALGRARGEWIAWLNADEFYLPGALSALHSSAMRTGADVVYGDAVFVDAEGRLNRLAPQHRFSRKVLAEYGCYISTCAVLMRREALGTEPWDVTARRRMDWDLFMRLATRGRRFVHLPYPVGAFREHDERVTASAWHEWKEEDGRLAARYGLPEHHLERWRASRVGRWLHPVLKLTDGAYLRQLRARRLEGQDLRWFRSEQGRVGCDRLRACYRGVRPS